jgi:GR25 family glycosyltransferase involved in LPS biosynthesis
MVETQIKFAVVAHHKRKDSARKLAKELAAKVFIDEIGVGANANHYRAIEWSIYQDERVIILEDDAVLTKSFKEKVKSWINRFPDHLCSFYLGTGRPPQYQLEVATKLIESDKNKTDYIKMQKLIHGVCYSIPKHHIKKVLNNWDRNKPADYAIGDAYSGAVIYPCYSLVDHADNEPVEEHHDNQERKERRKAWRLDG